MAVFVYFVIKIPVSKGKQIDRKMDGGTALYCAV